MLSKVASGTVNGIYHEKFSWQSSSQYGDMVNNNTNRRYVINNWTNKSYAFTGSVSKIILRNNFIDYSMNSIKIKLNDNYIVNGASIDKNSEYTATNFNFNIPANTAIDLYYESWAMSISSSDWRTNPCLKYIELFWQITKPISKTVSTHKSKPRQLKAIWEKATSTLYGYHTDNSRYTGE